MHLLRVDLKKTTYCEILGRRFLPESNDNIGQTSVYTDQGNTGPQITSVLSLVNETFFMYTHTVIIYNNYLFDNKY